MNTLAHKVKNKLEVLDKDNEVAKKVRRWAAYLRGSDIQRAVSTDWFLIFSPDAGVWAGFSDGAYAYDHHCWS